MTKKKETIISVALIAALLIVLYVLEQILPSTSMLFTVLKKGAIYALVAVSMNLLNGFTGLFSLGQAGFMLLGAYTYGILTIPVEQRENVYMYFDGGIVQFTVPVFVGTDRSRCGCSNFCISYRFACASPEKRLSGYCHTGLCGNYPCSVPVG